MKSVSLHELASDAADLSVSIETCRSSIFALSEMLRKTDKDLNAKTGRGISDTLEMINRNLMLADDEAKTLSTSLESVMPGSPTKGMKEVYFSVPEKHYEIVEKIMTITGEEPNQLAKESFYACMESELERIVDGVKIGDVLGFGDQTWYPSVFQERKS